MPLRMALSEEELNLLPLYQQLPETLRAEVIGYVKGLGDDARSAESVVLLQVRKKGKDRR